MQCSKCQESPTNGGSKRQDLVGDRTGAKEKGWAINLFLRDFVVFRSKEGKQRGGSEEWEMSC